MYLQLELTLCLMLIDYIDDQDIINDFCKDIWNGKAEDLMMIGRFNNPLQRNKAE